VVLPELKSATMVWEIGMVDNDDSKPVRSVNDYPVEALLRVSNGAGTDFCGKVLLSIGDVGI
jgi:hypothetical protein